VCPKPRDVDRNDTGKESTTGVPGTYNHLTELILEVEETRMMYLRRLRTLTDELLVSGWVGKVGFWQG
jgi:hypothetical protein